jgi:hypothetical protein
MQGIVKYVQHKTGNPVKYMISSDIEKDREEFEKRKHGAGEDHRSRYIQRLDFEIAEITDDPGEKFADYVLPKSDRICYDQSIKDAVADGMKFKKICNAIDWSVEHFTDREFSFEFYVDSTEEKSKITALVLKNGIRFEQYEFHGGKAPTVRTYF